MPSEPPETVLILGGTAEAFHLAERLVERGDLRVITSLAGRTQDPVLPPGEVRIGGFGGAEGLAAFMLENGVTRLVDATHPFAHRISQNAIKAAAQAGIALEHLVRPGWERQPGDHWHEVTSLDEAARALPAGATVFLALGRQYLDAFVARSDCRFVIRMVDAPQTPLAFTDYTLILGRPSADATREADLFSAHGITHVVCRNSGGAAGYGKIEAARQLRLPVVILSRRIEPTSPTLEKGRS
ncbi:MULTISPECIES: cobalt-precorrin-6A reductase [Alphaproteobacteria]|uniref:Precorrin-6A reductase n=2 Tax=Alphaproteobacteria TaxID=28211 RepID=A0A512HHT7_9HYPH|nr:MULTISPECIES: cobalt-precorrin-6A reductase [Alphaproteobacteria]GEO85015.1 precorrin-6A reductase [Ciceribacter naphthalenivorans]GLR22949.1 precorrin-6A reductase [Ciceribacter naphthalenivorans]GLT05805.1 precorrin-6A reductase [Sphingomonas psychrolutea]